MRKDWEMKRLGDLCTRQSSNIVQNRILENVGEYPLYGASGLIKYIDFFQQSNYYIGLIKDGSGVGRVSLLPGESSVIGTMQYIIPNKCIDIKFLFYLLTSLNLSRFVSGIAIPHIYFKDYSSEKVLLPPMLLQQKIVIELDTLNDIITKKKQQLEELDKLAQATFYEMFGDNNGNDKKWRSTKLSEVTDFLTSGSRGWSSYFSDKGSLFLTIKNVKGGKIDLSKVQYVNAPVNQEAIRTKVQEGDLLISITADLGRTAVVEKSISSYGAYINQHLSIIRLNKTVINPMFVSCYLESEAGKAQFVNKSQVGVKSGLNFSAINSLEIILPPKELQDYFSRSVESIESQKSLILQSLTDTQQLFDYTMNKYFGS